MRNSCRVSEGCISRPAPWAACAPLFEVDTLLRASHAAAPAPPGCGVEGGKRRRRGSSCRVYPVCFHFNESGLL